MKKKVRDIITLGSRKMLFSVFAVLMLLWGLHLTEDSQALATVYSSFAGSVVTITGLLIAGNVGSKFVNIKKALTNPKEEEKPQSE